MKFFKKGPDTKPDDVLEKGWQFYHRPTVLEPVGYIFRIAKDGTRYHVDTLTVESDRGAEAAGRIERQIDLGAGILARLLGIGPHVDAGAQSAETLTFELADPERETTSDASLDRVIDPFLSKLKYRTDNRYFLIRDCRWASGMTYRLSKERVAKLGGEATINEALALQGHVKAVSERLYEIDCKFPEKMRVMFLPEEIGPTSAGLGGGEPKLGLMPVTEPLVWHE